MMNEDLVKWHWQNKANSSHAYRQRAGPDDLRFHPEIKLSDPVNGVQKQNSPQKIDQETPIKTICVNIN